MEDSLLRYLANRPATRIQLAERLRLPPDDVAASVDEMQNRGWVFSAAAWYGNDPASGITLISLTAAGRREAERREAAAADTDEPIVLTRDELIAKLRQLGASDEQIALNPTLCESSFYFWPSVPAWAAKEDQP